MMNPTITIEKVAKAFSDNDYHQIESYGNALSNGLRIYHSLPRYSNPMIGGTNIIALELGLQILEYPVVLSLIQKKPIGNLLELALLIERAENGCINNDLNEFSRVLPIWQKVTRVIKKYLLRRIKSILPKELGSCFHVGAILNASEKRQVNLYNKYFNAVRNNSCKRQFFNSSLQKAGFDHNFANLISSFLPSAYVEQWDSVYQFAKNFKYKCIYSSLYGFMQDPVLAASSCLYQSEIIYVQHGGSYATSYHLNHFIEHNNCHRMLYWGLGAENIYQTRFAIAEDNQPLLHFGDFQVTLVLDYHCDTTEATCIVENVMKAIANLSDISSYLLVICLHPRSPRLNLIRTALMRIVTNNQIIVKAGAFRSENKSRGLVVYNTIDSTLMYERILLRLPFVVIQDSAFEFARKFSTNSNSFILKMQELGILCESATKSNLFSSFLVKDWITFLDEFRMQTYDIYDMFNALPDIYEYDRLRSAM